MKTSWFWRGVAWCVLLLAAGFSVYRAKTQTIAHDEALTYEWFLDQGVEHVLRYNTTNHILQTLLAKPAVKLLGVSEFTFRLPTLAGAGIYLVSVYLLCRRLFGDGVVFALSVAMLAWNPLARDFMVAARGFGLGLAFLLLAMYFIAELTERGEFRTGEKEWRRGCAMASVALALSVAANLTNIFPAFCLALACGWVGLGWPAAVPRLKDHRVREFAKYFIVPGVATGLFLLWPYLIQMRRGQFQIALTSATAALRDIFMASFLDKWTEDIYSPSLGAMTPLAGSWQARVLDLGVYVLLPLLFCFIALGVILAWRTTAESGTSSSRQTLVFGGSAIGCVLLTILLHALVNMNYPYSRYCLWAIPLLIVSGVLAAREIAARIPSPVVKGLGILVAAGIVVVNAQSLNAKTFRYNAYDLISLDLYRAIEKDAQARGLATVRVGGTWWYEPEINFYRLRYRATWMQEYEVKDKSYWWNTPNDLTPADYDYFVFIPASDPGPSGPRVRTIYHDAKTLTTIVAIARK
jgi:hypothetical protein